MKKKLFAVMVLGLLLHGMFGIARAVVYDPTADFSITNGNPNGVWSYGWMPTDFSTFNLYTGSFTNICCSSPQWYREPASWDFSPAIWRNDDKVSHYNVAPGQLSLHPSSTYEPSVLRWTAPSDGLYYIDGQFFSGDGGVMQVGVRQGSTWLLQGVNAGIFELSRSVIAGESIDFVVYGAYWSGNTPLEVTIYSCTDNDHDGYYAEGGACGPVDCDDNNSSVFPGANDSQCDGIDNNCDGIPDEGYVPTTTTCGIGACQASGQLICQNGSTVDTCTPGTPGTEGPFGNSTCSDAIDNDCDGLTDSADSNCQAVDLVETSVSNPPATAIIGSSFQVSDTVKNQGNIASGASTTRYYLSLDRRKSASDTRLTPGRAVPALNAGATSRGRKNVTIPTTTPAGTYYLLACADDTNTVSEGNEANNCKASSTTVQITP